MSAFARSYAQALLGVVPAGYDMDGFLQRADAIGRAIAAGGELKAFFAAPAVPREAKSKVIDELARKVGLDDLGRRFFQVLLQHRRLTAVTSILQAIRDEADRASGVVAARVTLAAPAADGDRDRIAAALTRAVGRGVRLTLDVDETILGGFVARVGSEVFDASVLRSIEQFREQNSQAAGD